MEVLATTTRGVSHYGLAMYIKIDFKAKEIIMETQIFYHGKNIIFKKSSKRNQNPSTYYNSIINLEFQHKPKYHHVFKNPHIKKDLLSLHSRSQNPLS